MTLQTDLCRDPARPRRTGCRCGLPGYPSSYRFAVQTAIVTIGGTVGHVRARSGKLGGPRWVDVTPDVQGLHWTVADPPGAPPDRRTSSTSG